MRGLLGSSDAGPERVLVFGLLLLHWSLAVSSSLHKSPAFDEVAHIGGAAMKALASDHRFNPESGLLPQQWAGLPMRWLDVALPSPESPMRRSGNVWTTGTALLFGLGNSPTVILLATRSMIALLSVALGFAVHRFSRRRYGQAGGLLALWLYAWSPTMLAHSRLVTADLCAALFLFLSALGMGRLVERLTPSRVLLSGTAIAGAALSKTSFLALGPVACILALWTVFRPTPWTWSIGARCGRLEERRWRAFAVLGTAMVMLGVLVFSIWSAYGWRYRAAGPSDDGGTFLHDWDSSRLAPTSLAANVLDVARESRVLPESFLWGTAYTLGTTGSRDAFLNGSVSSRGWVHFFPYTFLVKTPIPFQLLLALSISRWLLARRRGRAQLPPEDPAATALGLLFLVYGLIAVASSLNIGHRHLLPLYPVLFVVAAGALAPRSGATGPRRRSVALCLLLASVFAVNSMRIRPHYLSYFNVLAGGPANGWKHLVDSSLDWGQDLPALARILEEETGDVWLGYFGSVPPAAYGIDARNLASYFPRPMPEPPEPLTAGLYAVSATLLQGMHLGRPPAWSGVDEVAWTENRRNVADFLHAFRDPGGRQELLRRRDPGSWRQLFHEHHRLRSARLYAVLREREPDGRAGYSILLYHLSAGDLRAALDGPVASADVPKSDGSSPSPSARPTLSRSAGAPLLRPEPSGSLPTRPGAPRRRR